MICKILELVEQILFEILFKYFHYSNSAQRLGFVFKKEQCRGAQAITCSFVRMYLV